MRLAAIPFLLWIQTQMAYGLTVPMSVLPSQEGQGGRIYVPVQVSGFEGLMRLDTGATSSRIRKANWNQDLPVKDISRSMTASGQTRSCDVVEVPFLALKLQGRGKVQRSKYTVNRCPYESEEDLLGLDYLLGTEVRFDFKKHVLEINSKSPLPPLTPSPLKVITTGNPLLAIPLKSDAVNLFGMLDSGAEWTAVDERFVRLHPEAFEYLRDVELATDATGTGWIPKVYKLKTLEVGGELVTDLEVIVYDFGALRQALGTETPFILGYNFMSRFNWYLDLRDLTSATWIARRVGP